MKITLAILALVMGLNAFAQENTTNISEETGILASLRRSNIGIAFDNELKSTTKDAKIDGFWNKIGTYISYKMSPNDTFKLVAGYYLTDTNNTTAKWNSDSPNLRYKRSNILTEDLNFVTFNSELRLYAYPNDLKISKFQTGNTSWRNTFSRKVRPDFKLSGELRWDEYFRTTSAPKVARRKMMVTADPIYNLTESLTITPEVSFNSQMGGTNTPNKEYVVFKPMVDYAFNKSFIGQIYWEATPMVSRDDKFIARDFAPNGILGMLLTYTIL